MNTDNAYLVVLLVIGIVVLSNLVMFAMVRGWRGNDSDWFKSMRGTVNQSFKNDESLDELHKRVEALKKDEKEE
jgi:hypothetical protein